MTAPEEMEKNRTGTPRDAVRRALAERIQGRNRLRAERLARLRPCAANSNAKTAETPASLSARREAADSGAALEEFLHALSGGSANPTSGPEADPAPRPDPADVLRFHRPVSLPEPVCDLGRLTGAGPGLIWALQRANITCLADLAALEPDELMDRLDVLGRMIPAETWITTARRAIARRG